MNDIVKSTVYCTAIHSITNMLEYKIKNLPNIVTCILFQSLFVYRAGISLYKSYYPNYYQQSIVAIDTLKNVDYLTGYFIYDILYLLKTDPKSMFLVHHVIGLIMLYVVKKIGAPVDLLKSYNAISFIAEITNPFLNMRYLTKNTSYYSLNMKLILLTYTLFRMIAFPIVSFDLLRRLNSKILRLSFSSIYIMSLLWFKKIVYTLS